MGAFSTRIKLTERTVAAAKPATAKSKKGASCAKLYLDTDDAGFGLSVSAAGKKSYIVMRRVNGKQERHVFGYANELTVGAARDKAAKLLVQMKDGVSLNEQRRSKREEEKLEKVRGVTLAQALDLYEGTLLAKGRSKRTIDDYRYLVEKYLADWLGRALADISRTDARKRHAEIAAEIARGKYTSRRLRGAGFGKLTANHAMRAFRAVYNRALREHPELPTNPVINVDWNKEQRRTTRIPSAEMKAWYDGVQELKNYVRRDYQLFALFSGLRRENAAEVKVSHIDWKRRALHVPKPKSQVPFDLPLSDFMVDLLKERIEDNKKLAPGSSWVFPAARGKGHIVEVRIEGSTKSTQLARKRKGKEKDAGEEKRYSPHALRRTFISEAHSIGISPEARQLLVNHAMQKSDVHGGYVIPEIDVLRRDMQKITDHLLALCKPRAESSKVVPIRKKAAKAAR